MGANTMTKEAPSEYEQHRNALRLIRLMKGDVTTCALENVPLIVEGEGPLQALMTVIEVAERATVEKLTPILDASGRRLHGETNG